jgi:hypothetical protein
MPRCAPGLHRGALTLPGIAGVVLGIGLTVDANVELRSQATLSVPRPKAALMTKSPLASIAGWVSGAARA